MAVDKEANSLSRVYSYYSEFTMYHFTIYYQGIFQYVPQPFIFPQTKDTTTTTEIESCGAELWYIMNISQWNFTMYFAVCVIELRI